MYSASSAVTYTSVYTDSELGRVFWGADEEISDGGIPRVIVLGYDGLPIQPVAPPSLDYIPDPEDPQTPPVLQDEDEREPMVAFSNLLRDAIYAIFGLSELKIPYDTSDPANRFTPDREETMTLNNESRSKLNKDKVKPYDYTNQNSLYEIFKGPSLEYLYQLERAKKLERMWRKPVLESGRFGIQGLGYRLSRVSWEYGSSVFDLVPSWSLVSAGTVYAISSLMDTAYWMSEHRYAMAMIEIMLIWDMVESLIVGVPSLEETGYTKETIRIEYLSKRTDDPSKKSVHRPSDGPNSDGFLEVKRKNAKRKQDTNWASTSKDTTTNVTTNSTSRKHGNLDVNACSRRSIASPIHVYLHIKESLRVQDSDKPKSNNVVGPSVVNMVEKNNSSRCNDNKGKRKHHDNIRADPNKKAKPTCWKCGKTGHIKRDCKGVNVGNKSNGLGKKGSIDGSSNSLKDTCWFNTYESLNDGSILHMGNESTTLVHRRGCVDLRFSSGKIVSLFNVLHVPNIRKNLVSSSVLNNCGYKQVTESNKFVLSKHVVFIGFGYLSNHMFRLNIVNDNIGSAFMPTSKLNDSIIWHARLGHVHFKRMQDMSKDGLILAFDMDTEKCKTCMLTKITKTPFQNVKCKTEVLELIHIDLCYLHATPSLGNKKYFVTFIDDASRTGSRALGAVHSKAFRFYVIKPNNSVLINSIIESRDAIFDENRLSSVPIPNLRNPNGAEDIGGLVVPEEVTKELIEGTRDEKEAINDEMDSIMGNKKHESRNKCYRCGHSQYKPKEEGTSNWKDIPYKYMHYLPLTPRFQRLYMSKGMAQYMTWHHENRRQPGVLSHPSDGEAWKNFDQRHPQFAAELRNVRLGLSTDGFTPFGMSLTTYSCGPVIVTPYNLPPWMCMKIPYMFSTLIILGPHSPKNNIDVFLEPLIDELIQLWSDGVDIYDAFTEKERTC
ncbi:zinc finger, CCHC-type containing protein [Tanacetum coccineum]